MTSWRHRIRCLRYDGHRCKECGWRYDDYRHRRSCIDPWRIEDMRQESASWVS